MGGVNSGGISGAVLTPTNESETETEHYEDGDMHDPGFVIHPDLEGRPHTRSHSVFRVSSTVSEQAVDNQENIPPRLVPSTSSTDSHHWSPYSTHGSHSGGHTPGSRKREQSKLVNELLLLRGEEFGAASTNKIKSGTRNKREEVVELTPGRRRTRGMVGRGKDLLGKEVDGV